MHLDTPPPCTNEVPRILPDALTRICWPVLNRNFAFINRGDRMMHSSRTAPVLRNPQSLPAKTLPAGTPMRPNSSQPGCQARMVLAFAKAIRIIEMAAPVGLRVALCVLACLVCASVARSQTCAFSGISGSGFWAYNGNTFFVPPSGGSNGILTINFTVTGCQFQVESAQSWITFQGTTSGTNSTTSVQIPFSVAPNSSTSPIQGAITVTVNGTSEPQQTVFENSNSCTISLPISSATVAGSGGSYSFAINSGSCWWAWSNATASWVTIPAAQPSSNSLSYLVAANTGSARSSTIQVFEPPFVAPATFTVNQQAPGGLSITSPPPGELPAAIVGVAYTPLTFMASGGAGPPYTWSQTGLPASTNLSLSSEGVLSGTPANGSQGPYTLTVTVTDSGNNTQTGTYQLNIDPPPPVITSLSPSSATALGPAFTLTVYGTGFVSGATVDWNGAALATTYVSATQLTGAVGANLIASPGSASITVVDPGNVVSNSFPFTINPPPPPPPNIISLSPN